ncbi:MAG: NPCBM/NEW2 domain-containing protein, partial [Muribaculaceae bacterium]|nr:NPCBM/NEW2 domain-containing protein [Muribaculaceae bacterium]
IALPAGTRQIALVATDGGDGYNLDHADWINPTVYLKNGKALPLTDLTYSKGEAGWGKIQYNRNLLGKELKIDGKKYDNGIATHANSVIVFDLPEEAVRFTAIAGIDDQGISEGAKSSIEFMVFDHDATLDEQEIAPSEIALDLTEIGIPENTVCRITDLWTGEDLGSFSNKEFSRKLKPHTSGLFKISRSK